MRLKIVIKVRVDYVKVEQYCKEKNYESFLLFVRSPFHVYKGAHSAPQHSCIHKQCI